MMDMRTRVTRHLDVPFVAGIRIDRFKLGVGPRFPLSLMMRISLRMFLFSKSGEGTLKWVLDFTLVYYIPLTYRLILSS